MTHRVLVVDDNDDIRLLVRANLEFAGYEVTEARDYHEAVDRARSDRPDAIVLDVMLPTRDGFEVLGDLKDDDRTARIPVVMLTARTSRQDTFTGLASGASAYLTKPFTPMDLIGAIETALGDDPDVQALRQARAQAELDALRDSRK